MSLDGAVLAEKRDLLNQVIGTIVNGCANGVFPRCPDTGGPTDCAKCGFEEIGNPRHKAIWEKKRTDPRVAEYLQLRGGCVGRVFDPSQKWGGSQTRPTQPPVAEEEAAE